MKNRDLIRVLQMLEPDDEVTFVVGSDAEDRECAAKAALLDSYMLDNLTIRAVTLNPATDGLWAMVTLWQEDNELCIKAEHFNDIYVKK